MPGKVHMTEKEALARGIVSPPSPIQENTKDKTVHVHNYYHRPGGVSSGTGGVSSINTGHSQYYLIFAIGVIAGFLAGFVLALMLVGR